MNNHDHTHDIFLLMAQLSQIRAPERIWDFFISGINFVGLGVEVERSFTAKPNADRCLPVQFNGQLLGSLSYSGPASEDPSVLETLRNAAAVLATTLQARVASQELSSLRGHAGPSDEPEFRQRILETTPDIIYIYDLDEQRNIYVSRSIEASLGYSPEAIAEQGTALFATLIHPDDMPAVVANQARLAEAADGVVTEVTYRMRNADGQWRWFHSRETCFSRGPKGQVARKIGLGVDITERRAAEAHEREKQKLDAIGQLAGGVAHDFNNVLCAISGNAELMLLDLSVDDPSRESVEEILEASTRAADLTQQLLAFARKQVIKPRILNLAQTLEGMRPALETLLGEGVVLHTQIHEDGATIFSDPKHIEQIILNLATNARDAMPEGGVLTLSTNEVAFETETSDPNAHDLDALPAGTYVVLEVRDDGEGMSAEVCARIFEPFFTTKGLGRATGLGLATVFGMIKQHRGRIEAQSTPGEGSTFRLYFPRSHGPVAVDARGAEAKLSNGTETILVVEDENIVRKLAVKLLSSLGYQVLSAASGDEALALHTSHPGTIDLLLADVIMPGMNGREVADELTARQSDLDVLFTSGYTQNVIARQGVLAQETSFVAKPYSLQDLSKAIRDILDRRNQRPGPTPD